MPTFCTRSEFTSQANARVNFRESRAGRFPVRATGKGMVGRSSDRDSSQITRRRLHRLLIAFGIAYLASVDYLPGYGVPVYPIGYLLVFVFTMLVARTIWRYRLVDITDVQRTAGHWICLEISASCLRDDQGEPVGVVWIARPAPAATLRKAV